MKNKAEIKHEIFDLAQKISRESSEKFLLETAREIYELTALLKYTPKDEDQPVMREEKPVFAAEQSAKPEVLGKEPGPASSKQATIDLFSSDAPIAETASATPKPEIQPELIPAPVAEKSNPKEKPKKKAAESVAEKLQHNKITDLKAAIGINEKFQFINELFEGDMKEYNVAVEQINSFGSHAEAESFIAKLEGVYKWASDNQIVCNFKELVERRFA